MQRVVGAAREFGVDRDQILHRRDFGRQDDAIARQADFLGARGGKQRRLHHGFVRDLAGADRRGRRRILVHQSGEELLIERAPIDADAHRLVVFDRHLDDLGELRIALVLEADIARIDAVLVERLGAVRIVGEQRVAVVVEVADDRHAHVHLRQPLFDLGHRGGGFVAIDGDAHQFGTGSRQRRHLARRALDVGGVGVGHRLHDDGRAAANDDAADIDGHRLMTFLRCCAHEPPECQTNMTRSTRAKARYFALFTSTSPAATSTTAAPKAGVSGSPSTRWPAATPNSGVRNEKTESRLAE